LAFDHGRGKKASHSSRNFLQIVSILSLAINFGFKEKNPELIKINQNIKRNEGYLKSLKEDKKYP